MCGVFGLFASDPDPALDLEGCGRRMLDLLRHRGPDDRGLISSAGGVVSSGPRRRSGRAVDWVLGHTRLAVQDLSPEGEQPMSDAAGQYWISYNGEIYNPEHLRRTVAAPAGGWRSTTDTEPLVEHFARRGHRALSELQGQFAFLVVDTQANQLHVARDRFGIKPLYFWWTPEGVLAIASEIKAFTAWPTWSPRAHGRRVWDFLARGLIDHTRETLFEGVTQMPPGYRGTFDLQHLKSPIPWPAWYLLEAPEYWNRPPSDPASSLREALTASVEDRLLSDVPVGSCLSGGLDSSSIVLSMAEARKRRGAGGEFLTFTARSHRTELDEGDLAREVAQAAGAESVEVWPRGEDLWAQLDDLVWTQDEPFSSPSIFLQAELFRRARERGVIVMLDGQGADELLCGYHVFFKVRALELLRKGRLLELRRFLSAVRRRHGYSARALLGKGLAAAMPGFLATLGSRYTPLVQQLRKVLNARSLGILPFDPLGRYTARSRGVRAYSIEQLRHLSVPALLHWEDRNSMAVGVEARVPFLDHRVSELLLSCSADEHLQDGVTKSLLRRAMTDRLPERVRSRVDKLAFTAPEADWVTGASYREPATRALEQALEALGPWVRPEGAAMLSQQLDASLPYDNLLWRVIVLGTWMRRFGVKS